MTDNRHLNDAYFIDQNRFNCPFCGMRSVNYKIEKMEKFNNKNNSTANIFFVKCAGCGKISIHFSDKLGIFQKQDYTYGSYYNVFRLLEETNGDKYTLDQYFYHHIPSSFFTLDERIPRKVRDAFAEAQECKNSNFTIGASACVRKVIYTLLHEQLNIKHNKQPTQSIKDLGYKHYSDCIKDLKSMFPLIDPIYFSSLESITGITSDQVHEDSWEELDTQTLNILILAVRDLLNEIYVKPKEREENAKKIAAMHSAAQNKNKPKESVK